MKKIFTLFFLMTALFATAQQTADTMYVYKGGNIVERIPVSGIDSVIFALPFVPDTPVTPPTETQYEAVDLGLPSGIKWAAHNVGATTPEEYGGYYAWGETEEKENYDWSTYKWCNGSYDTQTKYCTNSSYGTVDNKTTLDLEDDVAHVKWGGSWRMPTKAEQDELRNNCTWTWTTQNGVKGYKVTSKTNGNSIFLPAAGWRQETSFYDSSNGRYWSSSSGGYGYTGAYGLGFSSVDYECGGSQRFQGYCVRPVCSEPAASSAVKIYGVRNDLSNPALTTWERTGYAVGMAATVEKHNVAAGKDDFLDVYPFNAIRECNIETLENGATKITYKGEPGFSLTDKDVFVEFPLWYERRYIKDGYEYREICAQQLGGFYPSPMFIEEGRVLDRVYIAKYETSVNGGVACSRSGKEPATYKTLAEFRELYQAKGEGYAGMDIRTVMSLQHLYLVRFAEKNTQNYIGGGYTDLYQPWGYAAKDYSGTVGGEVMVKNYVKTYPANSTFGDLTKVHWVGKQIGFVKSNETALYDRATITDMVVSEDGKQYTIYFDKDVEIITEAAGSPANSDSSPVRTWFGGCGQDTGATDSLVHDTGSTALAVANNKGSCAVKLFGLENMWGNVWHELDGIIFKGEYAFIGFSQKDYNNNADGYIPVAHQMLEQATLGNVGAQFCFIGNMWIDNAYPWIAYPQAVRGGSPTDRTKYTDGVNENSSYGDAYYFDSSANGGVSYEVHGGGFDHYERAGFFCHRCWNGINHKWYLQGSRMQFKIM